MFHDTFASIKWFCGGVNQTEDEVYIPYANSACKVPGRLVISRSGDKSYLVTAADRIEEILKNNGLFVEFFDTGCSGHCSNAESLSQDAWDWARKRPVKCGTDLGPAMTKWLPAPKGKP